jgi:hypothetical protein|tara:strand:- start:319 stop:516 length:198 start_codon:yes stop_codon:yes gene_type:complete
MKKQNAQQALDNIPAPIKGILSRSLHIAMHALKDELRDMAPEKDQGILNLIEAMDLVSSKMGRAF